MAEAPARYIELDGDAAKLLGRWTVENTGAIERDAPGSRPLPGRIDASALEALDSAGALVLLELAGATPLERIDGLDPRQRALLERVAASMRPAAREKHPPRGALELLAHIGAAVQESAQQGKRLVAFLGLVLETAARVVPRPARWRLTAVVHHIEQTGLDAVPIVGLLSFLVGGVVAYLAATVLQDFGAGIYTVELIGYAFLREFGPLLAAILVAGRSGSAFTAQIGAMKNREELDALRALGLDPIELLVLPRLSALLVALPILGLVGMIAGIAGGLVACATSLDISPDLYLARMRDAIDTRHFWVGLAKTPVFAFVIALVGCLEGMKVTGSAESVGQHTTSSVVQSIFLVILFDALFAVYFQQAGW